MSKKPYGGRLENWFIDGSQSVVGYLHDDPNDRFEKNGLIHTSYIVKMDRKGKTLETKNTRYSLGKSLEENLKKER